jgi:heptosyltransferase-2
MEARSVPLPHLDKDRANADVRLSQLRATLQDGLDLIICLRWEGQIDALLRSLTIESHTFAHVPNDVHVVIEHRLTVFPFTGMYDLHTSYRYPGSAFATCRPSAVESVGLCIAAGFHLNAWPLSHWLDLAKCLDRRGVEVVLVGGPAEALRLKVLADAVEDALGYYPAIVAGGSDFGATLGRLADAVDLVVATDSGTAHLASLVRPIVSLFGGSPWRRFAPLGRHNLILSRRYPCSPCYQFMRNSTNLCHTQECLNNLFPEQVDACLTAFLGGMDLQSAVVLDGVWMAQAPWNDANTLAAA